MSDFLAPLTRYSLDRAAQMLCAHGIDCTGEDLLTLWKESRIELCFPLPDYIACENVPAPGTGREVLLSVSPASYHVFWESVDYCPPPDDYARLCVKEYGSTDSYTERKLYVYTGPDYSVHDDNGQRLYAALLVMYGQDGLCIPGKELRKVFRFLTQPDGGNPSAEDKPVRLPALTAIHPDGCAATIMLFLIAACTAHRVITIAPIQRPKHSRLMAR